MLAANIFCVMLLLITISCTDSSTTTRVYRIVNSTTHAVELHFYEIPLKGQTNFVFATGLDDSGLVIERKLKTYALESNSPIEAFEADSIALIFNNERVEGHTFNSPAGNSMLTNYEEMETILRIPLPKKIITTPTLVMGRAIEG